MPARKAAHLLRVKGPTVRAMDQRAVRIGAAGEAERLRFGDCSFHRLIFDFMAAPGG
jgi:hypothetical protein